MQQCGLPEFDSSAPQNSHIPNGINRLAAVFEISVVARFNHETIFFIDKACDRVAACS
jgi:hypothetical protein